MSLPVVFRGLANREVHEIQAWYEARQAGLGGRIRASLDLVVHLVAEHPLACALAYREARRALVPGFPSALFYVVLRASSSVAHFAMARNRGDLTALRPLRR